jgi:hypothetical protein
MPSHHPTNRLEKARERRLVQFETELVGRDLRLLRGHLDILPDRDATFVILASCYPYLSQAQVERVRRLARTVLP